MGTTTYSSGMASGSSAHSSASSCQFTYTTGVGDVTSQYYPYEYPSNSWCKYVISQPPGATITLEFVDMAIESHKDAMNGNCYYDYVEVGVKECHLHFQ